MIDRQIQQFCNAKDNPLVEKTAQKYPGDKSS